MTIAVDLGRKATKQTKKANIRNTYNEATHLTKDTTWESVKNTKELRLQAGYAVSPLPAGDHKAALKRTRKHDKDKT